MLEIDHGSIVVNTIVQFHDDENVKHWMLDLKSKYPEWMIGSDDAEQTVMLYASERTIHAAATQVPTLLRLKLPWDEWIVLVDAARYTVHVVALRRIDDGKTVYDNRG